MKQPLDTPSSLDALLKPNPTRVDAMPKNGPDDRRKLGDTWPGFAAYVFRVYKKRLGPLGILVWGVVVAMIAFSAWPDVPKLKTDPGALDRNANDGGQKRSSSFVNATSQNDAANTRAHAVQSGGGKNYSQQNQTGAGGKIENDNRQNIQNGTRNKGVIVIAPQFEAVSAQITDRIATDVKIADPYSLTLDQRKLFERTLDACRGRSDGSLSEQNRWECAYAAAALARNGASVTDADRWLKPSYLTELGGELEKGSLPLRDGLDRIAQIALPLLMSAELAYDRDDLDTAINYFGRYATILKLTGVINDECPERANYIRAVTMQATAYLARANRMERDGTTLGMLSAAADNGTAAWMFLGLEKMLREHQQTDMAIPSLLFTPDAAGKPRGWVPKIKQPFAEFKLSTDASGTSIEFTVDKGSIQLISPLIITNPTGLKLQWEWKLDKMPDGAIIDGVSVNHPLSVSIGYFDRSRHTIVVVHYVYDPVKNVGEEWQDPNPDRVSTRVGDIVTEYPHVVVSDRTLKLGEWHAVGPRDLAADFKKLYKDREVPALYVVVIQSNTQGGDGADRRAVGSIRNLRLLRK